MSRTNKQTSGTKNPASKFLEWKSSKKAWVYYNKELEKEVEIPHASLNFIVLDQLNTAKGWDDNKGCGLWANEVRYVGQQPLTVKSKSGTVAEGLWKNIKGTDGLKFTKSVYAMAKMNGEYELVNLQLQGSALGSWFEFGEEHGDLEGDIVVGTPKTIEGKKGAVVYHSPDFQIVSNELSPEAAAKADEFDITLQGYLEEYMEKKPEASTPATPQVEDTPLPDEGLEVPF